LIKYRSLKINVPNIKKEIILPLAGGVLFFGNWSFALIAYSHLEGSIVLMLHQLNAIWLFLFGVFVFKEIDFKTHWLRLVIGLVFSIIGVVMLVLAKV
jgi:glucose uptake protein GlcU